MLQYLLADAIFTGMMHYRPPRCTLKDLIVRFSENLLNFSQFSSTEEIQWLVLLTEIQ